MWVHKMRLFAFYCPEDRTIERVIANSRDEAEKRLKKDFPGKEFRKAKAKCERVKLTWRIQGGF